MKTVWSTAVLQFSCTLHLGAAIAKISAADASLYQQAAIKARSRKEVEELVTRMTEKTRKKLTSDLRLEEWSMICCGMNYGNHTSNMSEGIHKTMLQARSLNMIGDDCPLIIPACTCADLVPLFVIFWSRFVCASDNCQLTDELCLPSTRTACFREIVDGEAQRFIKHHQLASKCTNDRFPPLVQRQLDNMMPTITARYDVSFCPSFSVRSLMSMS